MPKPDRVRRLRDSPVARNTALQILNHSFSIVSGLVIFGMSGRALGTEGYGAFALAVTYAAFVGIVIDAGLDTHLVKQLAASGAASTRSPDAQRLVADAFLLRAALAVGATALAVGAGALVGYSELVVAGIAILSLNALLLAIGMLVADIYLAAVDVRVAVLLTFVARLVGTASVVTLFAAGALTLVPLYLSTLAGGVAAVATVLAVGLRRGLIVPRPSPARALQLYRAAAPLAVWVALGQVVHRADAIILSVVPLDPALGISNAEAVGTYAAAYKFFELAVILPTFVVASLMPRLAVLAGTQPREFWSFLRRWLVRMTGMGIGLGLILAIVGGPALNLIAGEAFAAAAPLVAVLALAVPFTFVTALLFAGLVAQDRQAWVATLYVAVAAVNVVANVGLAPHYGYWASAIVTVVSQVLLAAGMAGLLLRVRRWQR